MQVLIDTNIILDALLEREPFVRDAEALFEAIESDQIEGYVTATTLAAISSNLPDFEDAVQVACTLNENLDAIITRDFQDFADATLSILSAGELLQRFS